MQLERGKRGRKKFYKKMGEGREELCIYRRGIGCISWDGMGECKIWASKMKYS